MTNNWATSCQKQQKRMCAQRRLSSAWASDQSDQSLHCLHEENLGPWVHSEDWSDWADAQAELSLRWVHMPFCWFCHEVAQSYSTFSLGATCDFDWWIHRFGWTYHIICRYSNFRYKWVKAWQNLLNVTCTQQRPSVQFVFKVCARHSVDSKWSKVSSCGWQWLIRPRIRLWMHMLIWVFVWCTCHFVDFVML